MSETLGQLVIGKRKRRDSLCFEEGVTSCKLVIIKQREAEFYCVLWEETRSGREEEEIYHVSRKG
eukprot:11360732-Ditylum_brightwellii.AAC.1